MYVNGAQVASQSVTGSIVTSSRSLRIGGNTISGNYFSGRIDEVRLFNQARTAAQITADMAGPVDTFPPTITSKSPAAGATGVSGATTVTATFSEAMNASTITTSTFELRTSSNAVVPSTLSYNSTTRVATLTPSASLASGASYTAIVHGGTVDPRVKDVSGNALASNMTWSFTIADTTPPTVISKSPASGATNVSSGTPVTATFSEAMNASTISTSTFQLKTSSNTLVASTVTYNTSTNVATLTPNAPLVSGTYTATVVGGTTDPRAKDWRAMRWLQV